MLPAMLASALFSVVAEARLAPDYYASGAQDPGRGQHYPLVPLAGCPSPLPPADYSGGRGDERVSVGRISESVIRH